MERRGGFFPGRSLLPFRVIIAWSVSELSRKERSGGFFQGMFSEIRLGEKVILVDAFPAPSLGE